MLSATLDEGLRAYDIGGRLRALRLSKKMGLVELGRHTGLSAALLSKIERGRLFPTLPTLLRIALVFGVGLEFFISDDSRRNAVAIVRRSRAPAVSRNPRRQGRLLLLRVARLHRRRAPPERLLRGFPARRGREGAPAPPPRRRVPVRPAGDGWRCAWPAMTTSWAPAIPSTSTRRGPTATGGSARSPARLSSCPCHDGPAGPADRRHGLRGWEAARRARAAWRGAALLCPPPGVAARPRGALDRSRRRRRARRSGRGSGPRRASTPPTI